MKNSEPVSKESKDTGATLKGLSGVLTILENFFAEMIKMSKTDDDDKKGEFVSTLEKRLRIGQKIVQQGSYLVNNTKNELNSLENLLDNVPFLNESFKMAQKGLKGISELTEEATVKIQDSNTQIQGSLDKVDEHLNKLDMSKFASNEDKVVFESCLNDIKKIADISFNIMLELQFQDILRQQLSAINSIILKTKQKIATSLENIKGVEISLEDEDKFYVATDESILSTRGAQDEVDKILSGEQ